MTEIERIRKMAADGTITQQQADELIGVIREIDRAETDVGDVGADADTAAASAATGPANTPPDMSRARAAATARPDRTGPRADIAAPFDTRWLTIDTLAGDIDVHADASVQAPVVDGPDDLRLEETADGWVLRFERNASFLDRFLGGHHSCDIDVRLPEGCGVDLRVKAGDIDLDGVPYLRGKILAGDVSASGVRGIDLTMSAGDLDVELAAAKGEHRVAMTAGDLRVVLDPSSDVEVTGRISIGDASVPDGFELRSKGLGATYRGTLGGGAARLEILQSTGDSTVEVAS